MAIKINKDYTSKVNTTYTPNRKIEYIVIHYTAGLSSVVGRAKGSVKNFALATRKASADFVIDDGDTVYQYNPDIANYRCWAVGGSKYNSCSWSGGGKFYDKCTNKNSISIEMCPNKIDNGKSYSSEDTDWYVTDEVWNNTVELTKQLMKTYDIDEDHVIRHFDVVGKFCPAFMCYTKKQDKYGITGNEVWAKFKSELKEKVSTTQQTEPSKVAYRVRKIGNDATTQIGAYSTLESAKSVCPVGYGVYNSETNKLEYSNVGTASDTKPSQTVPKPNIIKDTVDKIVDKIKEKTTKKSVIVCLQCNSSIKDIQKWLNAYEGIAFDGKLTTDGVFGLNSKKAYIGVLQYELNRSGSKLVVDGILGGNTLNAIEKYGVIKFGSTGIFVMLAQILLVTSKYNPNGIDGTCGNGCVTAIKKVQKDNKLNVDGIMGKNTWKALL